MKIDERALGVAQGKAADRGWLFTTRRHRLDLEEIIAAYFDTLAPKNDRIAVSRFVSGTGACKVLKDGEEPDWEEIEDWAGLPIVAARYIVRANVPPPAEHTPIEVDGEAEEAS